VEKQKADNRTMGTLIAIPWSGSMELRTSDYKETGVAFLGVYHSGATPDAKTKDNARRITSLWNAAEELKISTEAVEEGAIQKAFKACDDADTAFATINICDNLSPQARQALKETSKGFTGESARDKSLLKELIGKALKEAWAAVQEALITLKPESAYAEAVKKRRTVL